MWTKHAHGVVDTGDVNEHAASLSLWDQQYEQVSAGRFRGHIENLAIGPAQVFRERTEQAVLQRGTARPGTLTLAVPLPHSADGWFCGHRLAPGQAFSLRADLEFELVTHGSFDVLALCLDRDFLDDYATRVDGTGLSGTDASTHVLAGDETRNADLRELLLSCLGSASTRSSRLDPQAMQRSLVHALCDALLARLRRAPLPEAPLPHDTAPTRQRVVREAREYMRLHAHEAIDVPELCEVLHVSRRTLQYAFQDVLQLSPVTYLRVLRLNGVRRDLRRGGPEAVADHAARWGFWHLPRFAADYRALFDERPSETLARSRGLTGVH